MKDLISFPSLPLNVVITACDFTGNGSSVVPGPGLEHDFARNTLNGIHVTESQNIRVDGNLTEGNDRNGILFDAQMDGCRRIEVTGNISRNNGDDGIQMEQVVWGVVHDNSGNENGAEKMLNVAGSKQISF